VAEPASWLQISVLDSFTAAASSITESVNRSSPDVEERPRDGLKQSVFEGFERRVESVILLMS